VPERPCRSEIVVPRGVRAGARAGAPALAVAPGGLGALAGLAVAVALAVAAGASAQALEFPRLAADAVAGGGAVEQCTLAGAMGTVRCGVFRVDEGEPGGRTVDLHFVILDALEPDAAAPDPVLFFPGGPGAATIPAAPGMAIGLEAVRRTRDILLVDLRGVGLSGGLDCDVPHPRGLESRFGALFALDHIERCRDALAERAALDRYTTAASVDDLEALRRWLGYPRVNLYGGSYGTRVAQVYMRRHPESVRTVVMNGVAPIHRPEYVHMARYLQTALDRLVEECEAQAECDAAYPRFRAQLAGLLDRFAAGAVEVTVEGRAVAFSRGDLGYGLRGLLYARAADIPYLVDRAAAGDLKPLVGYYVERTDWIGARGGGAGNHLSVLCGEDIDPVTDADMEAATAGTFLGDHAIRGYRAACAVWPHAQLPATFFAPVESDTPTLLLSGGRDPATPPAGGDRVAGHLSRSLHVVVPNGGHGVFDLCILGMVVRLFEDGGLERVDPSCVAAAPPVRFRMPDA
jgi:pimeloyl-ACP methyl ester carboxylesterase